MSTLTLCPHTELPVSGCAHCRGDQSPAVVIGAYEAHRMSEGRPVPLPEYVGQPYGLMRSVKIGADSNTRCRVPGCTRPSSGHTVCHQCVDSLGVALGDVPKLQEDLLIAITRQSRFTASEPSTGIERPLPYAGPASAAWSSVNLALADAVVTLCRHRSVPRPWGCSGAVAISRFLLVNLEAVATDAEGGRLADAILSTSAKGRALIDSPADKVYLGLCAECNTAMHADPEALSHRCHVCGSAYEVQAQLDLLRDKVRSRLVTTGEMVSLQKVLDVPFTLRQVKGYVERKRLIPRGTRADGTHLYSVGEFIDLLESRKP